MAQETASDQNSECSCQHHQSLDMVRRKRIQNLTTHSKSTHEFLERDTEQPACRQRDQQRQHTIHDGASHNVCSGRFQVERESHMQAVRDNAEHD